MEPFDAWDCGSGCITNAGFTDFFPTDGCVGVPCTLGHTIELESEAPLTVTLDVAVVVTGGGADAPRGVFLDLDVE